MRKQKIFQWVLILGVSLQATTSHALSPKSSSTPDTPVVSRKAFKNLGGLRAREWWNAMEPERKKAVVRFFGLAGRRITIPADHNNPLGHFRHPELTAKEAQLLIFNSMANYVKTFLFHPETMLVRGEDGRLRLHPDLPQDKLYVVKWEANNTPNGDPLKGLNKAIGNRPMNQGEELGYTLEEIAAIPEVVGIKFMAYVDSAQPDTYKTIGEEMKKQAELAHAAGLLFFPEDLPAKSINGKSFDEKTPQGRREKAVWEARNAVLFAKALHDSQVDYDAYKFTFPGTLSIDPETGKRIMTDEEIETNLKEMAQYVQGRLVMMLSGGKKELVPMAEMAARYLPVVGFFPGRGVWGNAFWDIAPVQKDDRQAIEAMKQQIAEDLRAGGTKSRFDEINEVMMRAMKPFWEYLGLKKPERQTIPTTDTEARVQLAI